VEGEKAHLAYGDFDKEEIKTISDRHNFSRSQIYKLVERVNKYGLVCQRRFSADVTLGRFWGHGERAALGF
jgi:predicted transcriptional regulator